MSLDLWINKYKPSNINEIIGHGNQINALKSWLLNLPNAKNQSIIIYGNQGIGKTLCIKLLLEEQNYIEFISTSFIRGMSFDNAIIIVDEMQNLTYEEIDTVMTRVGHMSKIIWCGDYRQTDLNKKKTDVSGILKFFDIAYHMGAFTKIEFEAADIVRSSLVKDYILAKIRYEDMEN